MIFGFTGTHFGWTQRQRETVRYLFRELQLTELHHGDCVGSDAQADREAHACGAAVYAHPPSDPKLRAFCKSPTVVLPPKPYLKRDRDIVAAGTDGLIATPRQMQEPASKRGEGTWTTIGYARQAKRHIWIVFPDGTFKEENT